MHQLIVPLLVGGGKPVSPPSIRARLELVELRRFEGGVVLLHYRLAPTS